MKTLYLDCFAGLAGDMFIGALLNLVPDKRVLSEGIKKLTDLDPSEYELIIENTTKNGISGINFDVHTHHHHEHEHDHEHEHHHHGRNLADIEKIIMSSGLSDRVKIEALRAFSILAEAEAHVHGTTIDKIHFHEVGAVDSIIDIVGAFILMEALNWPRVLFSSINTGYGTVECAHGILPVPAPATEYLLHGLQIFSDSRLEPMERTTPTGALLAKVLAAGFSTIPPGKIIASGFGFGNHESKDIPNALRALLIETGNEIDGLIHEKISVIECNIDDMNPQDYEVVSEKLFMAEALDVWTENINMKKNRQGLKLCCLCKPDFALKLSNIILKFTTSQGVRIRDYDRVRLDWKIEEVETSLGKIHVKITNLNGEILRKIPEYEDIKRLSELNNMSMLEVRNLIAREI
ncbi:MAG: nickel pincer cofactor biosynthesis protein LarC [Synergistaceae bacterium]|nr:nickel pincer cofactor biosynthesis protein LarC [Synergistaceae bacterium]MBR0079754.1 nickel pincer cofactor biosynthesis protein LarC [Synergistaceae bacterium]